MRVFAKWLFLPNRQECPFCQNYMKPSPNGIAGIPVCDVYESPKVIYSSTSFVNYA